jgi:DNA-directed RNA polymerase specialized sigma24 family protein
VAGVCRRAHVRRAEQPGLDDLRQSPSKMPDQTSVPAFAWRERLFLPLEDRLLVRLVISGLHSEVIADILGVSAATVRKRWQRIRQRTIVELRAANADRDESSRASNQGILRNR